MSNRGLLKQMVKKLRFQIRTNRRMDRGEVSLCRAMVSGIHDDPTTRDSDRAIARRLLRAIDADQVQRYLDIVPGSRVPFLLNLNFGRK